MKIVNNKHYFLLVFFLMNISFYAQKSENAYLEFNTDSISKCFRGFNERDENGKMTIKYNKKDSREKGSFILCNNRFKIKPNSIIIEVKNRKTLEIISIEKFEKNISDIWNNSVMDINKHYKKIYVLEKISDNKYLGYEVYYDYNYFPDKD